MPIDPITALSPADRAALSGQAAGPRPIPQPTSAEIARAAQQFEAIMVRQLLTPSIEPMMNGGGLGGDSKSGGGGGVYGYMLTDVLATSVTQGGGLGLADVIARQLTPAASVAQPK